VLHSVYAYVVCQAWEMMSRHNREVNHCGYLYTLNHSYSNKTGFYTLHPNFTVVKVKVKNELIKRHKTKRV